MGVTSLYIFFCAAAYLLGAIPNGLLIARTQGVDIRTVGSGNIGATNVYRVLGKKLGICTLVLDALKGLIPTALFPLLAERCPLVGDTGFLAVLCAVCAIAGHNWPIYLRFRGGKGVATSAGALLGIAPAAFLVGLAIWLGVQRMSGYVSLASMLAAGTIAGAGWLLYADDPTPARPVVLTLLAATVLIRHRSNIQRLRAGTESRFGKRL